MTKKEVVNILGEPHEIKKNGVWVYHFPDDWVSTFYIKFKDGKIIKRWG